MEEVSPDFPPASESVGETLRAARERQGLNLSEIASRTRVPLRHLEAIEVGNYDGLPSPTYATGFVKAYARAVGVDEVAISRRVRAELANAGPRAQQYQPYEAPDPSRVPSRGLAAVTAGVALAVIVLLGLWYSGVLSRNNAAVDAVPIAAAGDAAAIAVNTPTAAQTAVVSAGGQVTLEVTDRVWLRVHDGDRNLYEATMNPGERFDVPADAANPLVDVGRPDKLKVTLNGSVLPPLAASARPVTNLRVSAQAVAARQNGTPAPSATPLPSPTTAAPRPLIPAPARFQPDPVPQINETRRANLDAATPPPAGNTQ